VTAGQGGGVPNGCTHELGCLWNWSARRWTQKPRFLFRQGSASNPWFISFPLRLPIGASTFYGASFRQLPPDGGKRAGTVNHGSVFGYSTSVNPWLCSRPYPVATVSLVVFVLAPGEMCMYVDKTRWAIQSYPAASRDLSTLRLTLESHRFESWPALNRKHPAERHISAEVTINRPPLTSKRIVLVFASQQQRKSSAIRIADAITTCSAITERGPSAHPGHSTPQFIGPPGCRPYWARPEAARNTKDGIPARRKC